MHARTPVLLWQPFESPHPSNDGGGRAAAATPMSLVYFVLSLLRPLNITLVLSIDLLGVA